MLIALAPGRGRAEDAFLLPGIELSSARLEVGAWCRYLVVDEAMGEIDTAVVYIAVTGSRGEGEDLAYWVEVENRPRGTADADREITKLLISSKINQLQPADSLCHYVLELYIKKGNDTPEPADPDDLKRLSLSTPTSDSTWTRTRDVVVSTPSGTFTCEHRQLSDESERRIPMGRATLIKHDRDEFEVWVADEVPIFSLVKCVIARSRNSRTEPAMRGIPNAGPRNSRTTVELVGFGDDAEPLITIH